MGKVHYLLPGERVSGRMPAADLAVINDRLNLEKLAAHLRQRIASGALHVDDPYEQARRRYRNGVEYARYPADPLIALAVRAHGGPSYCQGYDDGVRAQQALEVWAGPVTWFPPGKGGFVRWLRWIFGR